MLTEEELAIYESLLLVSADVMPDSMTDIEKIKAAHDYLVLTVSYDFAHIESGLCGETGTNEECHYVSGTMTNNVAVCSGYASTFRLLMTLEGINCHFVETIEDNHAWNVVELDGKWYQVDVTWDDQGGSISYKYFMTSNEVLAADGGHDNWFCDCGVAHMCNDIINVE